MAGPEQREVTDRNMRRAPTLRMILVAIVVSLGGPFHFGYQLLITNPAHSAFVQFLNKTLASELKIAASDGTLRALRVQINLYTLNLKTMSLKQIWSFIVAVLFLGALAGSFSIRLIADNIGRKRGLHLSVGLGVLSATASACSKVVS
ncbi:hypothetical protein KIN20_008253 [Parelaphostrongylus tenuis]|uniref:Major facilitator superfamily (MFS) profile domain-containing protein n=1 Tax=Parelaphostrongylus tenuis TaxID=148309 RepID=A0AAD5MWK5_PARTN|nr:hypothetical protein KIN20_008253 [Parelaphostrongylus tenuis]